MILKKNETVCWLGKNERAAFLFEGKNYFKAFFEAALQAKKSIYIVGWDFNSDTELLRGKDAKKARNDKMPTKIWEFLNYLCENNPDLQVRIINWDYYLVYGQERDHLLKGKAFFHDRIKVRFDDQHPLSASHHQKYVLLDEDLLFLGGLDFAQGRWDDKFHKIHNHLRKTPSGKSYPPFHDLQLMLKGECVAVMAKMFRDRWQLLTGEKLKDRHHRISVWPKYFEMEISDSERCGLSRTWPEYEEYEQVVEIEKLYRKAISEAKDYIYIENQYFISKKIVDYLGSSLSKKEGPEVIVLTVDHKESWLEGTVYGAFFNKFVKILKKKDKYGRLGIYSALVCEKGEEIDLKIHSKIMIVDDHFLTIGSANATNRSLGLDSELNFSFENEERVGRMLYLLLAEHGGSDWQKVKKWRENGESIKGIIEKFNSKRRKIVPLNRMGGQLMRLIPVPLKLIDPARPLITLKDMAAFNVYEKWSRKFSPLLILGLAFLTLFALALSWRVLINEGILDITRIRSLLEFAHGSDYAWIGAIGFYILGGMVLLPLLVMILAVAFFFDPLPAFGISFLGILLSASLNYLIGRKLGKRALKKVNTPVLNALNNKLKKNGFINTLLFRLVPIAPAGVVDLLAGASKISFRDFILATAVGIFPGLIVLILLGSTFQEIVQDFSWLKAGLLLVVGLFWLGVVWRLKRKFSR